MRSYSNELRSGPLGEAADFRGQPIRYIEVFGIPAEPREMRADGRKLEMKYDPSTRRLRVEIPDDAKEITLVR